MILTLFLKGATNQIFKLITSLNRSSAFSAVMYCPETFSSVLVLSKCIAFQVEPLSVIACHGISMDLAYYSEFSDMHPSFRAFRSC